MMVVRAGTHKMLVRIVNREDTCTDQTASSNLIWVCPVCLGFFWQRTSVLNFRTLTVYKVVNEGWTEGQTS